MKVSKKSDKYLDLARELKKQWNMISRLGTVPKGLERELEKLEIGVLIKTIKTTVLLRSARLQRRVMMT